ncbi:hypothetical protein [Alloactinosynnema sp. L-07]|uniref:hypothetical protein n=1 Tax=Alloactinosynnema sp. L-07 TaxID=1653480 RepID=UPI00065EF8EA|nr:hypothetical protein [Alloactinosynnema sp. L-07]CRK56366.1 hypothetical protein [Alloactinosynnema sp. L-07]
MQILTHLSQVALLAGDAQRALDLGLDSLAGSRRFDDRWAIAMAATTVGHARMAEGQVERARTAFDEAAKVFHDIGNPL